MALASNSIMIVSVGSYQDSGYLADIGIPDILPHAVTFTGGPTQWARTSAVPVYLGPTDGHTAGARSISSRGALALTVDRRALGQGC